MVKFKRWFKRHNSKLARIALVLSLLGNLLLCYQTYDLRKKLDTLWSVNEYLLDRCVDELPALPQGAKPEKLPYSY